MARHSLKENLCIVVELKDTLNYRIFLFQILFSDGTKDLHVLVNESSNSNVTGI